MEQLREPINNFIYNWQPKGNADHAQEYFKSELFEMIEAAMRDAWEHSTIENIDAQMGYSVPTFSDYFSQVKETLINK